LSYLLIRKTVLF